MSLAEYAHKRDFKKTAEPGAVRAKAKGSRFVIQKHAASRLHYDFRLEIDGVLKSWAVPKGMPFTKGEKRLAVHVEDHPVSYIDFEGSIPKGQYGGGTVMVWDRGTFSTDVASPLKELERGKLHFTLDGKKLHGEWYLVQLRGSTQWLLIKGSEDLKPVSKKSDDTSALSGKTMVQLGRNGSVWESKPRDPINSFKARLQAKVAKAPAIKIKAAKAAKTPPVKFIEPMKAHLASTPPTGDGWSYEIKFDGFRALAFKHGDNVRLLSRNEKDFNEKFPEIVTALAGLKVDEAVIDGEIVALDHQGISSFQLLQAYEKGEQRPAIHFYVFDLLRLNGKDLRGLTLIERKSLLEGLIRKKNGFIRYSASLGDDAPSLLKHVKKLGLEGLIGKRNDSTYESGRRSDAWIKLKLHNEQEFVIGGFTDPEGSRDHFGALLLGIHEKKKLKFCGKVGTGFDRKLLKSLGARFDALAQAECPFSNLPEKSTGRFGGGITAGEMKRCHWIKPAMVAQIRFSEWTRDEKLRQPVFLGLREDKAAREVVREKKG
ncbi:MAG TPA: non-homologous end-joining DNA ligase [Verrucomicrobiae bacterium]|nr:non-homologous end-joining DNA ligase [Verrucomicrobiae bacterium]